MLASVAAGSILLALAKLAVAQDGTISLVSPTRYFCAQMTSLDLPVIPFVASNTCKVGSKHASADFQK